MKYRLINMEQDFCTMYERRFLLFKGDCYDLTTSTKLFVKVDCKQIKKRDRLLLRIFEINMRPEMNSLTRVDRKSVV